MYPTLSIPIPTIKQKLQSFLFLAVLTQPSFAQEHSLETILGAKLLRAAQAETTLTDTQKLSEYRCRMLKKFEVSTSSAIDRALVYSCQNPVVGVAFYFGNDLGKHSPEKIAKYIEKEFSKVGMKAKVFIDSSKNGNSNISYIVRGGKNMMNPKEPFEAIKTIAGFSANTKLALFADNIISPETLEAWSKANAAYIPKALGDDFN